VDIHRETKNETLVVGRYNFSFEKFLSFVHLSASYPWLIHRVIKKYVLLFVHIT